MLQSMSDSGAAKTALLKKQNDILDMISLRFSPDKTYAIGDFCLYFNGTFDGLYQFTSAKEGGVWDDSKVKQVNLSSILASFKNDVTSALLKTPIIETIIRQSSTVEISYGAYLLIGYNMSGNGKYISFLIGYSGSEAGRRVNEEILNLGYFSVEIPEDVSTTTVNVTFSGEVGEFAFIKLI